MGEPGAPRTGSLGLVLRRLLTLRWLAGLTLALAGSGVMLALGRWQLNRGESTHSLQNYAYAVEWALFAAFTMFCFYRLAREADLPRDDPPARVESSVLVPPRAAEPDETDPELVAYNAYLARLNGRS